MPKKKGLGRDVEKSVEVMENLLTCLAQFHKIPIKRGLKLNGIVDDKFSKSLNDIKESAYSLHIKIEDLLDQVKGVKSETNNRFACERVVEKFLNSNNLFIQS